MINRLTTVKRLNSFIEQKCNGSFFFSISLFFSFCLNWLISIYSTSQNCSFLFSLQRDFGQRHHLSDLRQSQLYVQSSQSFLLWSILRTRMPWSRCTHLYSQVDQSDSIGIGRLVCFVQFQTMFTISDQFIDVFGQKNDQNVSDRVLIGHRSLWSMMTELHQKY